MKATVFIVALHLLHMDGLINWIAFRSFMYLHTMLTEVLNEVQIFAHLRNLLENMLTTHMIWYCCHNTYRLHMCRLSRTMHDPPDLMSSLPSYFTDPYNTQISRGLCCLILNLVQNGPMIRLLPQEPEVLSSSSVEVFTSKFFCQQWHKVCCHSQQQCESPNTFAQHIVCTLCWLCLGVTVKHIWFTYIHTISHPTTILKKKPFLLA